MAFVLGRGFVDMELDDGKVNKGLTGFQGRLKKFEAGLTRWVKRIGVALGGGIIAALGFSIREASQAAQVQAKLVAVLEATGNAAGLSIEQLNAQATALQNLTEISDETIGATQAVLLTFKEIRGPIFLDAIKVITNLVSVLGGDTVNAAKQVGKALQDPIIGITALRRSGVSFTEAQREQIKVWVESGEIVKAQTLILKEMVDQLGEAAKRAKEASTGIQGLKNIVGDFAEALGDPLLPVLRDTNTELGKLFDPERAKKWGKGLADTLQGLPIVFREARAGWKMLFDIPEKAQAAIGAALLARAGGRGLGGTLAAGGAALLGEGLPALGQAGGELMAAAATKAARDALAKEIAARRKAPPARGGEAAPFEPAVGALFGTDDVMKVLSKIEGIESERAKIEQQIADEQKVFTPGFTSLDEGWRMLSTTTEKADDKKIGLMEKQLTKLDELKGLYEAFLSVAEAGPVYD